MNGKPPTASAAINRAWITGLLGVISLQVGGYFYGLFDVPKNGWIFGGRQFTSSIPTSILAVLICTAVIMFLSELMLRFYYERSNAFSIDEDIKAGRYGRFLRNYLLSLAGNVFWLAAFWIFYHFANEYAFGQEKGKYRDWFIIYDIILKNLCWFLPVYTLLTRCLQSDAAMDKKEPGWLVAWLILALCEWLLPRNLRDRQRLTRAQRLPQTPYESAQILLALFVKAFYIPLMTIFFIDQFSSLGKNWLYLLNHFNPQAPEYDYMRRLTDVYNIGFTVIFTVDVGLAWAGYVFVSRWIKNNIYSTEPTFLGWAVTLLCYPPFSMALFYYFSAPSDKDFMKIPNAPFITVLVVLSLISYAIYAGSTIFFGLRFSNLTHRGIVTTGFYRWIRHPAYAGKNISWWLVMLPYIGYEVFTQKSAVPLFQVLGLVMMTTLYYRRAVTEERHLSLDPVYRDYMQRVKYRFIPGVF